MQSDTVPPPAPSGTRNVIARSLRPAAAYSAALAAISVVLLLRLALEPWLQGELPFVTLFAGVAFAAWYSGAGPAGVAALVGAVVCEAAFTSRARAFDTFGFADAIGLLAYLVSCAAIIGFAEGMRRAVHRERERSEILRVTFASIGDAVVTTDADGRVTYLNAVAEALTGWSLRDAKGLALETAFDIVEEATRLRVENPARRALREGRIVGLANHTVLRSKDGTEHVIDDSASPIVDARGDISGTVLIFRDVTRQRRAEDATARLAAIVTSSDDAILSKDLQSRILSWNTGAERLFGYTADEAIGQSVVMLIPEGLRDEEPEILARITNGQRVEHYETVRQRKDGSLLEISLSVSPIFDSTGRVVGASKIARDISERRRQEEALRESDRRKDEFLAILAHELRNPLAPLRNALGILERMPERPDDFDPILELMERQLGQMVRLIDDLLDVSRISRGRLELRREPVKVQSVVEQAIETCHPLAERGAHELIVSLPSEAIHVNADPLRLAQVFANLLSNACKFTERGGRIHLTASRDGDDAVVSVRDTGIGIEHDARDRIFETFAQVKTTLEQSQGGLGLGLSLAKRITELHGGTIEARSEGPGRGSEFLVRLPLVPEPPPFEARPNEASEPVTRGVSAQRILVVDDSHDSAESMSLLLQIHGNETRSAHDGVEAVAMAEEFRPDVVLMDIGMPRMDGYDACRRIRQRPWGRDVVLVALTGWGQAEDKRRSQEAGFDEHMVKPVDYAALMELLARVRRRA